MKSPLKKSPLRHAGQSLDEQIDDLMLDGGLMYIMMATVMLILTGFEWMHWFFKTPPMPKLFTFLSIIVCIYCFFKVRKTISKARNLKLGRDGERAVGQFLEELRADGAEVFHDIIGEHFNLDHVVVHRSGIYVIETKTWSKPERGEAKIVFNGQAVIRQGFDANPAPIIQAKAASYWLAEFIKESTGHKVAVRAVVVFPGWYIETTSNTRDSSVWVLNPRALPSFLNKRDPELVAEEMKMYAFQIRNYIRMNDKMKRK